MLKSKNKFLLLLLVVILITGLCFGLIACKDPKPEPNPNPDPDPVPPVEEPSSAEVFAEVLNKIASSYSVGTDFKIDAAASADIRKKNADGTVSKGDEYAEGDFAFELIVKANVKLGKDFTDEDNYYLIELNDKVSGNSIVQLYFETQSGKGVADGNFFYASLFGSEVFKINGLSLEKAMGVNNNVNSTAAIEIPSALNMVIGILFTEYEINDGNYTFKTDINGIWELVSMMAGDSASLKSLLGGIDIFAGIDLDAVFNGIDSAIVRMFPNLTLSDGTKVTGYDTMVKFINENIPKFTTNVTFNFDGNTFKNATFYMDMVPQPDTFTGYTVNAEVSKVDINADTFPKDNVLAGSFIEKFYTKNGAKIESRYTAEAINLVNFNYNTSVQFLDAEKKVVRDMDIRINADINPFSIIGGITKESIMNMGSFSIEIQNVNNGPYQVGIHFDPQKSGDDSVYFYIALSTNNADPADKDNTMVLASQFSIINVIASLTNDFGYIDPSVATTADDAVDIGGIMDTIGKLFGAFTFSNEDVTITTDPIFDLLITALNIQGIDISGLLIGNGTEYIRVAGGTFDYAKSQTVEFNPNKWVAESLKEKISNGVIKPDEKPDGETEVKPDNNGKYGKYVNSSTIKFKDKTQVAYGTPFEQLFQANKDGVFANVAYQYIDSTDVVNANIQIQKAMGYNPTKVGKQKVVLQASVNSDLSLIAALVDIPGVSLMNILSNVPIVAEIEVLPADSNITAKVKGTTEMAVGDSIIEKLKADIITHDASGNEVGFALTKYMIAAVSDGINFNNLTATKAGKQWIEVTLATGTVTIEFNVASVDFKGIAVLGGNLTTALQAELNYVDADGNLQIKVLGKADITLIKVDGSDYAKIVNGVLTQTGRGNVIDIASDALTIADADSNLKKSIEISYKYEVADKVLTLTNSILISKQGSGTAITPNSALGGALKLGSSLTEALSIDIYKDSKVLAANYKIVYLPFEGKNADGETVYDYSNSGYGIKAGSVLLDAANYKVNIVVKDANGNDVTADVFKNGVFVKGGTYTITISGSITIDGEVYSFKSNVEDIYGDTITVQNSYNTLSLSPSYIENDGNDKLTVGKRMLSNPYAIQLSYLSLKDYPLNVNSDNMQFNGGLIWNDTEKAYYVAPNNAWMNVPKQIVEKLPITAKQKADLVSKIQKGMSVKFYYSSADSAPDVSSTDWKALCDENGYVTAGGNVWIKVVADFEEEFASVTNRKINISYGNAAVEGSISQDKGIYTYYTGQKITFAQAEYFVAGVSNKVDVTNDMLAVASGSADKLSTDGFIRFTATGDYTVNVTVKDGFVIPVQFKIVAPGLQGNYKDATVSDQAFFGVGTDIYEIMANYGIFNQIVVDENGAVTTKTASAADIKAGDPITNMVIFATTGGINFDTNGVITKVPDNCKSIGFMTADMMSTFAVKAGAGNVGEVTMSGGFTTSGLQVGDSLIDVIINNSLISVVQSVDATTGKAVVSVVDAEWIKANVTFSGASYTEGIDENGVITEVGMGMFQVTLKSDAKKTFLILNQ